jgi:hypothetical protein
MKMPKHARKLDLKDATYLDRLGETAAKAYAPIVRAQAENMRISLPVDGANAALLLDNTIVSLNQQGKIDWDKTPSDRQQVFIEAWGAAMRHLGIIE